MSLHRAELHFMEKQNTHQGPLPPTPRCPAQDTLEFHQNPTSLSPVPLHKGGDGGDRTRPFRATALTSAVHCPKLHGTCNLLVCTSPEVTPVPRVTGGFLARP